MDLDLNWVRGINKSTMITHKTSTRVVEEAFTISSPYEFMQFSYKFNKVERWFSYWTVLPIGRLSYMCVFAFKNSTLRKHAYVM